jgi:hypothetical protein
LLFDLEPPGGEFHLLSPQGVSTLLDVFILGGLAASLYALYKICGRLAAARPGLKHLALPFLLAVVVGSAYLSAI